MNVRSIDAPLLENREPAYADVNVDQMEKPATADTDIAYLLSNGSNQHALTLAYIIYTVGT